MCRLACSDISGLEVSDYEINKSGKSYTIYTVEHFRKEYPEDELYWLVGSDMLLSFETWFRYREILKNTSVAAISRTGDDINELLKMSDKLSEYGKCIVINADVITISSTELRKMIKNNCDLSCYLNGKVVKYIILKNLYK